MWCVVPLGSEHESHCSRGETLQDQRTAQTGEGNDTSRRRCEWNGIRSFWCWFFCAGFWEYSSVHGDGTSGTDWARRSGVSSGGPGTCNVFFFTKSSCALVSLPFLCSIPTADWRVVWTKVGAPSSSRRKPTPPPRRKLLITSKSRWEIFPFPSPPPSFKFEVVLF